MFQNLKVCLILLVSAVIVTAHPPGNFSSAMRGSRLARSVRPYEENEFLTFCEDNNVPHDTWFIHPWSCDWWLVCYIDADTDLIRTWNIECDPPGSWGIPNTRGECAWPNDGDICPNNPIVWPPVQNGCPPPGSDELVFLPSEFYCDIFYVCINGVPMEVQCRPGQHWNAEKNYCDHPSRAGCDGPNGGPPVLPECPIGEPGVYPFPGDCNLFVNCERNGNRSVQRCPHLHYFDIKERRCVIFFDADCIDDHRGRVR